MPNDDQRELFKWQWPLAAKYPLNNEKGNVETWVRDDLEASENYLILTGFSSLEYLIQEIGDEEIWVNRCITVVLGNEPIIQEELIKKHLTRKRNTLSSHIAEYWLEKGISIKLNGPLLSLTKAIEDNEIQFKLHPTLHGKVYVGDHNLIMGSSNFSYSGMKDQAEINVRYDKERSEYEDLKGIAEHYKSKGKAYNEDLLKLLKKLLQFVNWEEALARAVAELLEGDWVEKYFKDLHPGQEFSLWPTQRQAIGQALYILDNEGSVLIAEPTGSGKTRVGAHLLAALLNRFWQQGRGSRSKYKIIAPPLVLVNWQEELDNLYFTVANPISHGILSRLDSSKNQTHLEEIQDATVLLVDEAHNYLNISSNRTQTIRNNKADHVILFTATPINRKWNDLLRMVELLGLDNLSKEAYKAYKKLKRTRRRSGAKPSDQILGQLKKYSQKFIVRRTKREINEIIDRRPEHFKDSDGNMCRFPKHVCNTYSIKQSEEDIELGRQIDRLSNDLKGLIYLKKIHMPKALIEDGVDPQDFVNGRIRSAPALSRYNIKNALRSSRAALIEHLLGTDEACRWAGIDSLSKTSSGNIIATLKDIERLPRVQNIDRKYLPDWLTDEELYWKAVEKEISLLSSIASCVKDMSDSRERSKANFLADLLDDHSHILAFDEIVISHSVIHKHIKDRLSEDTQLVIATGGRNDGGKEELQILFHPSTESSSVIGLCTDALSEGVNLQKSSAVVFLDMPTVIRKAEQRAGRVDRLDSPHDKIDIYWPKDHKVFQLEADKKFIERHDLVDNVIGSNIRVPDDFTINGKENIGSELMTELYQQRQEEDREWAGVDDAFKPVREFIEEDGLIDKDLYERFKEISAKVLSRVSIVKSNDHWGFFAIRGTNKRAPKWVLIRDDKLIRDLPEISGFLRERLPQCANITKRLKRADRYVNNMVNKLNEGRLELLPNKRRLALNIFEELIKKWLKNEQSKETTDQSLLRIYKKFQNLYKNHYKIQEFSIDCYEFSQLLLDVYYPYFEEAEKDSSYKRNRNINSLRELKPWLENNPIGIEHLEYLWENLPTEESLDKQVAAAIIAIPEGEV